MSSNGSRSDTALVLVRSSTERTSASNSSSLIDSYGSSRYIVVIASPTSYVCWCWLAAHGLDIVRAGDRPTRRSATGQPGPTEDEVGVTLRVISLVAVGVG